MTQWVAHSAYTDPGAHTAALDSIAADPSAVVEAVQGLLIHGGALQHYGLATQAFSRETLTVEHRLASLLAEDATPLGVPRAPPARAVGTCRDYALLLCSIFRQKGYAARVRCGFASYLGGLPWEDHWICEVLLGDEWTRVDAQLDPVLRIALGTTVLPIQLPLTAFLDAGQAWIACRSGRSDPNEFGHGEATGLWFVLVNLVRDRLALQDRLSSSWDCWRAVEPLRPTLPVPMLDLGDTLAGGALRGPIPEPWWSA